MHPENFENFTLPIAAYDRHGVIVGANRIFRSLTGITQDDMRSGAANLFDRLDETNDGLAQAAHNAFDGGESVCEGTGCPLRTHAGKAAEYQLSRHPNALLFPMARDRAGVRLAGILLDENKTDHDMG